MARNRPRTAAPKSGPTVPTDSRRFLSTGGGRYAYFCVAGRSYHGTPGELIEHVDAWLEVCGNANERDIVAAQAAEMAERWPEAGWDRLVDHVTAGAEGTDEADAA